MFNKALILLDGSEAAEVILQYVPSFVCSSGTEQITLMSVSKDADESDEYLAEQAGKIVKAWHLDSCEIPAIEVSSALAGHRDIPDTAADFVETHDVDAIMLITGGSSGADWWTTGSVAQQIIKSSTMPVYLARLGSGRHPRPGIIKRILLPLDGSLLAEQALPFAERIARNASAEINLVTVGADSGQKSTEESSDRVYVDIDVSKYLDAISDNLKRSIKNVSVTIKEGLAGQQIAEMAQDEKFDLIVMSSHGHTGPGRGAFGGVTERVLHGCHVPVLVIPPKLKTPEVREDAP